MRQTPSPPPPHRHTNHKQPQQQQLSGGSHGGGGGGGGAVAPSLHGSTLGSNHGRGQRRSGGRGGAPYRSRAGKWDEVKLWQLGYRQELRRSFTMLNNMAICTSVLSFYAVVDTYGSQGLAYGGPVSVVWGWVLCSAFSVVVALCLAELLSAYPTSGGIYYWSWVMAPVRYRTLICWIAGWLNLLGQVAFTAGLEYALANSVASTLYLHTEGRGAAGGGTRLGRGAVLGVLAGMLVFHGLLNSLSSSVTAFTNTLSLFWHLLATGGLCAALLATPPTLNASRYVFAAWTPNADVHGIKSPAYIFLIGLLMSQWIIMGYDASIHVVEETIDAENAGSIALVGSVAITCGLGFALLLCLTFAMQSMTNILNTGHGGGSDGHNAVTQLLWDVFRARYGSGSGALGLSYVPLLGLFFCANASLAANARMAYAFSRDGAMPGARLWRRLAAGSGLPVAATWLMALLAGLLAAPCVYNDLFFSTVSAGSVVALSLSYGIPIFLRIFHSRHTFLPGPFNLGRAAKPLAVVACCWIALTSVVFVLPTTYPVTPGSANYTAPLVAAVLALAAVLFYAPGFGGRLWFTGPAPNLD